MKIRTNDGFDLQKIEKSGQCFRAKDLGDGTFRFITEEHVLYIRNSAFNEFDLSCTETEWDSVWRTYFDLDRNYRSICDKIPAEDVFMQRAAEFGSGIRILRQDPFPFYGKDAGILQQYAFHYAIEHKKEI